MPKPKSLLFFRVEAHVHKASRKVLVMKPKFIILGIVLCVLFSAPLKASTDVLDSAAISGAFPKSAGVFILLTVGVLLTLIAWEKVKFDREHKANQNTRREAYWQALKKNSGQQ